jgi:hypothetical protein
MVSSPRTNRDTLGAALVTGLVAVALGWQFFADASRAVPALDTAWYQWRAEFLLAGQPAGLIEIRGAQDSLAGGYRVAEPVLAALMRLVGGAAAGTPTVILSVLFRVLAAAGVAAFAWTHRRDWPLFYLTLLSVPALFLLQRFFGFLDNFFALALMAGVLLLLEPMRSSWVARGAATAFLFLGGMSHPTTVALFLLSYGAVIVYRFLRVRSVGLIVRSEWPMILAGTLATLLTAAFWLGGLWGRPAGLGEAAVPPPQPVSYFVDRSLGVLGNLTPLVLFPLIGVGAVSLARAALRRREAFAEVSLAWTLPLLGMFGFLVGAAYPYFRFFNGTLAPLLLAAVGMVVAVRFVRGLRAPWGRAASFLAPLAILALLGTWWIRGLSQWNAGTTWLTPEVRESLVAADAYLDAAPAGTKALFVIDAQPSAEAVPYGEYKEYTNSIYAGLDGDVTNTFIYFGRVEDLIAGRPSSIGDKQYDSISAATAEDALPAMNRYRGNLIVFLPSVFNQYSPNADFPQRCSGEECGELLSESGLWHILPAAAGTVRSDAALDAAAEAAASARQFARDPPGPLANLGGTLLTLLRLALLLLLPGWLLLRRLPDRTGVADIALAPLLSIGAVTTLGIVFVALTRAPIAPGAGWVIWAAAVFLGLVVGLAPARRARPEAPSSPGA